jgi:putative multiple sugar transport system permease protein
MPNAAVPIAEAAPKLHAGFLKNNLREYGMLISLVAIMVLFQVLTDGTLLRPLNLTNLLLQNSYIVIMALGMLLVIVARAHRPVGGLGLRLHRRAGGGADGRVRMALRADRHHQHCRRARSSARRRAGSSRSARSRRSSSRWRACWCSRGSRWRCCGAVGRPIPGRVPAAELGLHSRSAGRRHAAHHLAGRRRAGRGGAGVLQAARARQAGGARHGETEPYAFFLVKNLFFAAIILFFSYLLSTYKGLPNVLIVMAVLIVVYDFVTNRTTIGRRIYALGGNEKAAGCRA